MARLVPEDRILIETDSPFLTPVPLRGQSNEPAFVTHVAKLLASAVANAVHNDGLDAEELFVSACYADEGSTLKRWRPRARGRATRIRKRTSHITVVVQSRKPVAPKPAPKKATASKAAPSAAGKKD